MARHRNNNGDINNNSNQQSNAQESFFNTDILYGDDPRIIDLAGTMLTRLFLNTNNIVLLVGIDSLMESSGLAINLENAFLIGARIEDRVSAFPSQFHEFIKDMIDRCKKRQNLKKALQRNKPYVYKKTMNPAECTVCLNDFKEKESIRKLSCEHEFHKKCIDKWLLEGNSCCPLCRKEPYPVSKK